MRQLQQLFEPFVGARQRRFERADAFEQVLFSRAFLAVEKRGVVCVRDEHQARAAAVTIVRF